MKLLRLAALAALVSALALPLVAADPPVVLDGKDGPSKGKHIVLISGDQEYRSEEAIPQLAKICNTSKATAMANWASYRARMMIRSGSSSTIPPIARPTRPGIPPEEFRPKHRLRFSQIRSFF